MDYQYAAGDRVRHRLYRWVGEVTSRVPGNNVGWYYVRWEDDGDDNCYLERDLEKI